MIDLSGAAIALVVALPITAVLLVIFAAIKSETSRSAFEREAIAHRAGCYAVGNNGSPEFKWNDQLSQTTEETK